MVTINFLYVHIRCPGQVFDGDVFKRTGFYELPEESLLDLPDMCTLSGKEKLCPRSVSFGFPSSPNILNPYSGCQETRIKNTCF